MILEELLLHFFYFLKKVFLVGYLSSSEKNLLNFLSEELVRYKIPRSFEFVNEPLRDDAGKARRSAIAQDIITTSQLTHE